MQKTADDPNRFAGLRSAALERARETYSWDKVVDQYEALFRKMINA
jgi:glycosyltransferase involved in cell wall biosynthesis